MLFLRIGKQLKASKLMANEFDRIFKENARVLISAVARKVLGIEGLENAEEVKATLQKTIEREPDWLLKIVNPALGESTIFHGEIQTDDVTNMLDRKLVYFALLWSEHHLPVRQVVIYIGRKKKPTNILRTSRLVLPNIDFRIEVINIRDVPYDLFINSDVPKEVIIAILCDFKSKPQVEVLKQIVLRLKELDKNEELTFGKHIVQLEILSSLRNLQPLLTKTIDAMPLVYDLNKDIRFNQGIEKGIEKGVEKGELIKSQKSVIHLLKKEKFSFETIADFAEVDLEFVRETHKSYLLTLSMLKNNCSLDEIVAKTGLFIEVIQKIEQ